MAQVQESVSGMKVMAVDRAGVPATDPVLRALLNARLALGTQDGRLVLDVALDVSLDCCLGGKRKAQGAEISDCFHSSKRVRCIEDFLADEELEQQLQREAGIASDAVMAARLGLDTLLPTLDMVIPGPVPCFENIHERIINAYSMVETLEERERDAQNRLQAQLAAQLALVAQPHAPACQQDPEVEIRETMANVSSMRAALKENKLRVLLLLACDDRGLTDSEAGEVQSMYDLMEATEQGEARVEELLYATGGNGKGRVSRAIAESISLFNEEPEVYVGVGRFDHEASSSRD